MITSTPTVAKREVLEVTFLLERNRFDDGTIIGEAYISGDSGDSGDSVESCDSDDLDGSFDGEQITIKAPTEPNDCLLPNLPYRLYGKWKTHPRYGRQFIVDSWIRTKPTSRDAIVNYLMRQAEIGSKTAEILFDLFGKECLDRLREDPAAASAAVLAENKSTRFSVKRAEKAADKLSQDEATEAIAVELIDLFAGRGLPKGLHRKVIGAFGARSNELIRRNPYLLLRFDRVGFKSADNLYCELGLPKHRLKRQALCACYAIESDRDGHTWLSKGDVLKAMRGIVGATIDFDRAMKLAIRARLLDERKTCVNCGGKGTRAAIVPNVETGEIENQVQTCFMCQGSGGDSFYSTWQRSQNEQVIAELVAYHNSKHSHFLDWIDESKLGDLTHHQREQLIKSLQSRICAFCGIPGTGKTYSMARLVGGIIPEVGELNILVAAPTGKAAVRMSENLNAYGLSINARTMDSLLLSLDVNGELYFRETVFLIDETSMDNTDLLCRFLRRIPIGGHLLMIGDINQLPPVGHGAPLRDLLKARLPTGELQEIQRQKEPGLAVLACDKIRQGKTFDCVNWSDVEIGKAKNLGLYQATEEDDILSGILKIIKHYQSEELNPIWDFQVIVARNDNGKLSRKYINSMLQAELNPLGSKEGSTPFRSGDKIVCLENGDVPSSDDDGSYRLANGELGRVVEAKSNLTFARFMYPNRDVKIPRGVGESNGKDSDDNKTDTGCSFDLGYALTCHKMQGSQQKVIIVVLDKAGVKSICSREWIYTAISRMELACFLVGDPSLIQQMIRRVSLNKRRTFLVERLEEEMKKRTKDKISWEV